jgi:hypothetical protein
MHTHADKTQENKSQSVANAISQKQSGGESTFQFVDNRPETIAQRKLQEMANNSPQAEQVAHLQAIATNHSANTQLIQKKENNTGLPDNLKSGIENLSGYSMDDVKVHYNSDKPAPLQAHAFAQGTDIHLASGQEKHLPHEAWHVVQQKQGRVKPSMQMKGKVNINNDTGLEKEADVMGAKAKTMGESFAQNSPLALSKNSGAMPLQKQVIQRTTDELDEWRDDIWKGLNTQIVDNLYDIVEAVENQEVKDSDNQDPGVFLENEFETQNELLDGDGHDQISHEEQFANLEQGTLNTAGIRKQLGAMSDGVRGRATELKLIYELAVNNRYAVQAGAINGRGGDLSVRAGNNWADERTYQIKDTSSESQTLVDKIVNKAAEQLHGDHGERPYQIDKRIITVFVRNPNNPYPGTPMTMQRASRASILARFRLRLQGNANKLVGADRVRIYYIPQLTMTDGATVSFLQHDLNGNGGLVGAGVVV